MEIIHALMLGTTNAAKIHGVQAAFADVRAALQAPDLGLPHTWTCQVETGVSDEPWGFATTVQGAQNRAQAAYARLMGGAGPGPAGQVAFGVGGGGVFFVVALMCFPLFYFRVGPLFGRPAFFLGFFSGFQPPPPFGPQHFSRSTVISTGPPVYHRDC